MSRPRIFKLFLDVNMNLSHRGLAEMAVKARCNPETLSEEDLLMFINKAGDKLKILGGGSKVIGYLNLKGRRIMMDAIQYIPQTFGSTGFDYDQAVRTALTKRLAL